MKKDTVNAKSNELGFGSKNVSGRNRFLNKNGKINIRRKGKNFMESFDVYHTLINMSWIKFLLLIVASYIVVNIIFAGVYYYLGAKSFGNIEVSDPVKSFEDLFFFSAQTLTTVGYGYVYPKTAAVSSVAAVESLIGLLIFAIATGVLYGRFSKPNATILYSEKMLVAPYKGITGLMFRIANPKRNELIEIEAQVTVSMINRETNSRSFLQLPLELSRINFLSINWTVVHPIDETSPIYGMSQEDLLAAEVEFIIMIKAMNDTYSQTVYSRSSYVADEIVFGARFKSFDIKPGNKGRTIVDITALSEYDTVELPVERVAAGSV
ncbi:MAG: ion transporter [Bacteroidetes bacterium]|jgi:inward rectifier potassium channel|nr:ion transporter [Bacteroidota bacterium]